MVQTRAAKRKPVEAPSPAETRTVATKKRRRGKPGEICQLNLDVLFLIAAYVHPIDLLNLARTCKSLRQLLMDKCSTFVWRTAREQTHGLPDCPPDLTEPEYANLAFFARCHLCGKYAKPVLWKMRRRYCANCRFERLCTWSTCPEVIRLNSILPTENVTVLGETSTWVDKHQLDSIMKEYDHSSDKTQFLKTKREQYTAIVVHASRCERWQAARELDRKMALDRRRDDRSHSIFERLKQIGYEREVTYFGATTIRQSCKALFRKSKPLTDKEWGLIWPHWTETFDTFRSRRLQESVYPSRERSLVTKYVTYALSQPPNARHLPHAVDVASFAPFRALIRAPEDSPMDDLFQSAFAQLPELADEWKKKLDVDIAELVKIPACLSLNAGDGQSVAPGSESPAPPATADKLRLACAMFRADPRGIFTYPEVLSVALLGPHYPSRGESHPERDGTIHQRYKIEYVPEAAYVIHACGLDPHVATVDDMDRLNPRLTCRFCRACTTSSWTSRARRWRDAVMHMRYNHGYSLETRPHGWELVGDEHLAAVQEAEALPPSNSKPDLWRCVLCARRVGDAKHKFEMTRHLLADHKIAEEEMKEGVHYVPFDTLLEMVSVEMVKEGDKATFKNPGFLLTDF